MTDRAPDEPADGAAEGARPPTVDKTGEAGATLDPEAPEPSGPVATRFNFEGKVFRIDGAFFETDPATNAPYTGAGSRFFARACATATDSNHGF